MKIIEDNKNIKHLKNLSRSEIREIKNNQSELYMENDNFKVIIPYTHDAVKIYGKGTSWCVSWAKDEDYQFYNKTGKILLILKKNVHIKDNTEIDDVCYKVSMWMPYQKYLPLYRNFGKGGIEDIAKRYESDKELYKSVLNGYVNSVDGITIHKITADFEYYDADDAHCFMPVKYIEGDKVVCIDRDWELDWEIFESIRYKYEYEWQFEG